MALTDIAVKNAKPREKLYRLKDERGLFLEVPPSQGKRWRLRYTVPTTGKETMLSFGTYPDVSLVLARKRRDEARRLLAQGIDPGAARKCEKSEARQEEETFELVAREWLAKASPAWSKNHTAAVLGRIEADLFPWLGNRPIMGITTPELLAVIRRIESRGAIDIAHRVHQYATKIFQFAVSTGRAERNPAMDLKGALTVAKVKHHSSLTDPKDVSQLLRAIDGYTGHFVTQSALRIAPLLFVRPGELRHAEWREIDLDAGEWRIPGPKMKMREQHIVPLSRQAVEVLRELHPLTGSGKYVFPSVRTPARPMSENTVNAALRRMGYTKDEMTGHGFRSMASTILNEQGWNRDAIERQLAHAERNSIRAAYNFAEFLPERRKMMQSWADLLDGLKAGGKVIPIRQTLEK